MRRQESAGLTCVLTEPFKKAKAFSEPAMPYAQDEVEAAPPAKDVNFLAPALFSTTERKLMAKIDWRVVPVLTIMYLLAFLDRVNIANANVFGLSKDLHLVGNEYNIALVIFFVPYCMFEIPSNILLKRLRPHVWLSGCMFVFGLASLCQGFVTSYGGLLAARWFLGMAETGMFPGCFYLISSFYVRDEAQRRITFFFSSATLAGAFGGLLAAAIGKMDGIRGYAGWRWVFILEGLLTCVVAIVWYFAISDFPEDAKWLSEEERAFVKGRLQADQGRSNFEHKLGLKDVGRFFSMDLKFILGGFMYFGLIVPAYVCLRSVLLLTAASLTQGRDTRTSRRPSSRATATGRSRRSCTLCLRGPPRGASPCSLLSCPTSSSIASRS